ncbi:hypothetical protein Amet_4251 [Alkaliphilus metalliredigens QYMF]|uniref:Uncharacterized protein n=1 Tax=Alkaliphilus metalliredigens (strain QYMF) TaxID=293826 RepID=A6TVW1_ALKMQ|nr:hypothetical protein [Alkaliphilus metalliredigens]ABR50329.1 hypothetical protein Amet_4251 [Alkaliphilus metalliredigens QYMF]
MKEESVNESVIEKDMEALEDRSVSEKAEQHMREINKEKTYLLELQQQEVQRAEQLQRLELIIDLVQDELNSKTEEIKNLQSEVDKLKPKHKAMIRKEQLDVGDSM